MHMILPTMQVLRSGRVGPFPADLFLRNVRHPRLGRIRHRAPWHSLHYVESQSIDDCKATSIVYNRLPLSLVEHRPTASSCQDKKMGEPDRFSGTLREIAVAVRPLSLST